MMLPTVAIGFGVPAASMYYLDSVMAVIVSSIAIFFAFILGTISVVGLEKFPPDIDKGEGKELNLLRAHQRAALEEFDDIAAILMEIRDILKAVEKRA